MYETEHLHWQISHLLVCSQFVIGFYVLIDCRARLRRTLFMVGEIGGNDYGHGFEQGWSIQQVNGLVPKVIGVTETAVTVSSTS